eukprot:2782197-Pyramimonas_sp.AAC.1
MSGMFALVTAVGNAPSSQQYVSMQLFRKPKRGRRPIGFFISVERLHGRTLAYEAKQRERTLGSLPQFSMASGRGPLDAVWRQSARGENLSQSGYHLLSVLWDLKQFYEHISHATLWTQAMLVECPLASLRYTLNMYKWQRIVAMGGLVALPIWPARGFLAGTSTATYE